MITVITLLSLTPAILTENSNFSDSYFATGSILKTELFSTSLIFTSLKLGIFEKQWTFIQFSPIAAVVKTVIL